MESPSAMRVQSLADESFRSPTAGPNHAASALCLWAILWCLLCTVLLFYGPLQSVFLGGSFQKDAYSMQLCGILFLAAAFV
jgi:hypothetical protein